MFLKKILVLIVLIWLAPLAFAEMAVMTDEELAEIEAEGITRMQLTNGGDTIRIGLNIYAEVYARVESLKLGYYERTDLYTFKYGSISNDGRDNDYMELLSYNAAQSNSENENQNSYDWDIDWNSVTLGRTVTMPFRLDGIIIKAYFDNYTNNSTRRLRRLTIGSERVQGEFVGHLDRISGMLSASLVNDDWLASQWWMPIKFKRDGMIRQHWGSFVMGRNNSWDPFYLSIVNYNDHLGFELIAGYGEQYIEFYYKNHADM